MDLAHDRLVVLKSAGVKLIAGEFGDVLGRNVRVAPVLDEKICVVAG